VNPATAIHPPRDVDNRFRHRGCPACGSPEASLVGLLNYGPLASFGSMNVRLSLTPELWRCRTCKSWFTQNIVAPEIATALYSEGQSDVKWPTQALSSAKTPELLAALDQLLQGPARKVVDVGCNTGELLDYCAARGSQTWGIELSPSSREVCAGKGHRMVPSLAAVGTDADLVFAFDLVEHLHDLKAFVREAHRALRPGGRLVVLTGNNTSLVAHWSRARWWYLQYPEHILFASPKAWSQAEGFKLVQRLRTYASIGYRVGPGARLKGLALMLLGRGIGLPLLCGDHHLLVLQKT
jgi:SAM-dependent methyltransferase